MPLTFLEAAETILKEAGHPLHYREITQKAAERSLISSEGKTPEATMGAQLYMSVKKAEDRGEPGKFRAVGRGQFTLQGEQIASDLAKDVKKHNSDVRQELHQYLSEMHPRQMELLVGQLLTAIGFSDVVVTDYSNDGGIDVEAILTVGGVTSVRTAIQVKRWKKNVSGSTVRELRGGLKTDQRGLIITTSGFTRDAMEESGADGKTPISLIDGERFIELLTEHQIGIRKTSVQLLELNVGELVLEENEESRGQKSGVLWPLPGGQENFFETLLKFLDHIGTNNPNIEEMTEWVFKNFERVTKHKLVKSYLRAVLYSIGLINFDGAKVLLTTEGESLRKSRKKDDLLAMLRQNILGIEELLGCLKNNGPSDNESIRLYLCEQLNLNWETDAQVKYRLQWLATCGAVKKDASGWANAA